MIKQSTTLKKRQLVEHIMSINYTMNGIGLNKIVEEFKKTGLKIDRVALKRDHIEPLIEENIIIAVNPDMKGNRRYRLVKNDN